MWFLALLGLVYHNSKSSALHVTVPSGKARHVQHAIAKSTSWVVKFTDPHGVLVFSSDGDCEIYLGVHSSAGSPTEWYVGDGSTSGVISMGNMWGTVEIFSKSDATAMFTACYLGNPAENPGAYSEFRTFSSGSDKVDEMNENTRLGFVVVGPNVTVSTEWIQGSPSELSMNAYGWDSSVSVGTNRRFTTGAVWMLELATTTKVTPKLTVTFEGGSDVSFSNVTFDWARDKFGMFNESSFVEFARVPGVPSSRDAHVGTTWPGITSLVLFIISVVVVVVAPLVKREVSDSRLQNMAKRRLEQDPERDLALELINLDASDRQVGETPRNGETTEAMERPETSD